MPVRCFHRGRGCFSGVIVSRRGAGCVHRCGRNTGPCQRESLCQHRVWLGGLRVVHGHGRAEWQPHRHGLGRDHAHHLLLHRHRLVHPGCQPLVHGSLRRFYVASGGAMCGPGRPTAHHRCPGGSSCQCRCSAMRHWPSSVRHTKTYGCASCRHIAVSPCPTRNPLSASCPSCRLRRYLTTSYLLSLDTTHAASSSSWISDMRPYMILRNNYRI